MSEIRENLYQGQNGFNKKSGDFELQGLEPLPLTKITEEAQKKLVTWGMTLEEVSALRNFTSQFRYDLCSAKVARIAQIPVEIFSSWGRDCVNLPMFYDVNGRLDGDCGDIGRQWVIQMNDSNLIEELNQSSKGLIVPVIYKGLSETHFIFEGQNHVWNGLALTDKNGDVVDEIYFDAAFQSIHSKTETKYVQTMVTLNPKTINLIENAEIFIGWIEINGDVWKVEEPGYVTLGTSSDYEFIYSLGFLKDRQTKVIKPIVNRTSKDGSNVFCFIGNEDQILTNGVIDTSDYEEIGKILREAQKIKFVEKPPTENRVTWARNEIIGGDGKSKD